MYPRKHDTHSSGDGSATAHRVGGAFSRATRTSCSASLGLGVAVACIQGAPTAARLSGSYADPSLEQLMNLKVERVYGASKHEQKVTHTERRHLTNSRTMARAQTAGCMVTNLRHLITQLLPSCDISLTVWNVFAKPNEVPSAANLAHDAPAQARRSLRLRLTRTF
jgi:hypothetical protein